jgi:hypothetical protein
MGLQITNWVSMEKFEHTGIAKKAAEKHKATEENQLFVKRIGKSLWTYLNFSMNCRKARVLRLNLNRWKL